MHGDDTGRKGILSSPWFKSLSEPSRPEPLAAFRIAATLVALLDFAFLFARRELYFGSELAGSPIPRALFQASFAA